MSNDELKNEVNRVGKLIDRFRDDLVPNVSNIDNHTRKLPECLDAIHDQLIEIESELSKGLKYQSRSANALESIAESLKSIDSNYKEQFKLLFRKDV